jgi:ATP-dependent DNA helicase RecG
LAEEATSLLEPTRQTARLSFPSYRLRSEALKRLGTAVRYHRRTEDEIDRKVAVHVREYGRINSRTVQNMFDVSVQRARDILRDLVQRKILRKTSKAQRGPSVEYGAGPRFPASRKRVAE